MVTDIALNNNNNNNNLKNENINQNETEILFNSTKRVVISLLDELIEICANEQSNSRIEDDEITLKKQQLQEENIKLLKSKIQKNNQLLRESLNTGYKRLRLIQTKYFQTYVAQQLTQILELKEKESACFKTSLAAAATHSVSSKSSSIDDNSVDLLTSILKSNLKSNDTPAPADHTDTVDSAVKSLLDDIQYEISKQTDEHAESKIDCSSSTDDDNNEDEENEQDFTVSGEFNMSSFKSNKEANVTDTHKKLIDSSNLFWDKSRTQLGSDWERVKTKLKYLKLKSKQSVEQLERRDNLIKKFQTPPKLEPLKSSPSSSDPIIEVYTLSPPRSPGSPTETVGEQAIAALSTSLQESIAAVTKLNESANKTCMTKSKSRCATSSRCIPYDVSSKKSSRLFNLNRSDLVRLDEDVLRSFFCTLKYFSHTYFKTMCLCQKTNEVLYSNKNLTNYLYKKKKRNSRDTCVNMADDCKENLSECNENSSSSAADSLFLKKTCIFCHLLKTYEKSRMDLFSFSNINSKNRLNNSNKKKSQLNAANEAHNQRMTSSTSSSAFADLSQVISDHSYCKQPNPISLNALPSQSCNKKHKSTDSIEQQLNETERIDKLVIERLNKIYESNSLEEHNLNKKLIFINEEIKFKQCDDDQFIDAGLELSPDVLKNLPDFSYEE